MAEQAFRFEVENDLQFDKYFNGFEKASEKAKVAVGIQLINNIVNGEGGTDVIPPIDQGTLWGSGSVFVGDKHVYTTPGQGGSPEPATSYDAPREVITVGFNTSYAEWLHENDWNPGSRSEAAGNADKKYIKQHLESDAEELMMLYAVLTKKWSGG